MKKLLFAIWLCGLCCCFAADGLAIFQNGLQAFPQSGPEALLNAWFTGRHDVEKTNQLRERFASVTKTLGPALDSEVFAPQSLGARVQRLYGVVYFERRPLWIRAEYYSVGNRAGFISLDCSLNPDEILPAAVAVTR